jgi:hypothetical protein
MLLGAKAATSLVLRSTDVIPKRLPALARNVVILAFRHAISDSVGGPDPDKADSIRYSANYYSLALSDFIGPQACGTDSHAREKFSALLPNWRFEYRVTTQQHATAEFAACAQEVVSTPTAGPAAPLHH